MALFSEASLRQHLFLETRHSPSATCNEMGHNGSTSDPPPLDVYQFFRESYRVKYQHRDQTQFSSVVKLYRVEYLHPTDRSTHIEIKYFVPGFCVFYLAKVLLPEPARPSIATTLLLAPDLEAIFAFSTPESSQWRPVRVNFRSWAGGSVSSALCSSTGGQKAATHGG